LSKKKELVKWEVYGRDDEKSPFDFKLEWQLLNEEILKVEEDCRVVYRVEESIIEFV